jgi:quinol monooxygenase YgiN
MKMASGVMVTVEMVFKPGTADAFCASLPEMLKDTAKRAGFQSLKAVRHKDDPNKVLMVEHWDSEDQYNAYLAWRQERGDMDALGPSLISFQANFWPHVVANV